ncbi:MAG: XdhC family protein [Desulfurococcales archaeon]|nr:XdhC family protein [Desulfurococcales archaeon]
MGLSRELPPEKLLQVALQALSRGEPVAIATIVKKEGSGPRREGSKIVVLKDGSVYGTLGGGSFEAHVVKTALQALKEGTPVRKRYSFVGRPVKDAVDTGLICGGVLEVFVDVLRPSPRAVVFGVGRVGKPLADLLNFLGFRVVVLDPAQDLVREDVFPYAEGRYAGSLDEVVAKLKDLVREEDFVLVTHGEPESDYRVTKAGF